MRISSRERKAVILLLVGAAALAVDKLLLPTPEAAQAAGDESAAAAADARPPLPRSPQPLALPYCEEPGAEDTIPDVFNIARLGKTAALIQRRPTDGANEMTDAEQFKQRYRLRGVVLGPNPVALVNRRIVHPGETLDGFVLKSVGGNCATFVAGDETVTLQVPGPGNRK